MYVMMTDNDNTNLSELERRGQSACTSKEILCTVSITLTQELQRKSVAISFKSPPMIREITVYLASDLHYTT